MYDLPKFPGSNAWVRNIAGGWQWSGIFTVQSGGPLTILAGKDQSQTGLGTDRAVYLGGNPYGTGACGLLFRTALGGPLNGTGYGEVWQGARPHGAPPAQQASR